MKQAVTRAQYEALPAPVRSWLALGMSPKQWDAMYPPHPRREHELDAEDLGVIVLE